MSLADDPSNPNLSRRRAGRKKAFSEDYETPYGEFIEPENLGFMVDSLRDVRERLQAVALSDDPRQLTDDEIVVVLVRVWGTAAPRLLRLAQRGSYDLVFRNTLWNRDCPQQTIAEFISPAYDQPVAQGTVSKWLRSASDKLGVRDDGDERLSALRLVFLQAFLPGFRYPW